MAYGVVSGVEAFGFGIIAFLDMLKGFFQQSTRFFRGFACQRRARAAWKTFPGFAAGSLSGKLGREGTTERLPQEEKPKVMQAWEADKDAAVNEESSRMNL